MFVRQSKYDKLESDLQKSRDLAKEYKRNYLNIKDKYDKLYDRWDELVDKVNSKGGQKFLNKVVVLDEDMIKKMLQLCHPDKHQGKQIAVEVTQVLLKMKGKK